MQLSVVSPSDVPLPETLLNFLKQYSSTGNNE
jgi:hypothetical protein